MARSSRSRAGDTSPVDARARLGHDEPALAAPLATFQGDWPTFVWTGQEPTTAITGHIGWGQNKVPTPNRSLPADQNSVRDQRKLGYRPATRTGPRGSCRSGARTTSQTHGAHLLPAKTRERFADALVRSLDTAELNRALNVAIGLLLDQSDQAPALAARVGNHLRAITESEAPLPAFES
jgi:hypothetical protein